MRLDNNLNLRVSTAMYEGVLSCAQTYSVSAGEVVRWAINDFLAADSVRNAGTGTQGRAVFSFLSPLPDPGTPDADL